VTEEGDYQVDGERAACAAGEHQDVLACARKEALSELFPGWRVWLDHAGWHARRRAGAFQHEYRPGAPAFHVSARTATDLAAQLCWQQAAEEHAPVGCLSGVPLPPPWGGGSRLRRSA
jgi:hypothetical protein